MSNFINMYGGNKDTMRHSGKKAIENALAAGLTINQIRDQAAREGVSFGHLGQELLNKTPSNSFIAQFGGNASTAAHSGMSAVTRAMAAGYSPAQIDQRATVEGVSFGSGARNFLNTQAQQVQESKLMQDRFTAEMTKMQKMMQTQQTQYQDNLARITNTMQTAANPNNRESVLGIKGASGSEDLGRRGMKGTFARSGLRIKNINV